MESTSIAIRRQGRTVFLLTAAHNDTTRCYPRTLGEAFPQCDAHSAVACHKHRMPLHKRAIWWAIAWGWAVVPCLLAVSVLTSCSAESQYAIDNAVSTKTATAAKEAALVTRP